MDTSANDITAVCNDLRDFLLAKNAAYGDSALDPVRVFSRASPVEQLRVRIDDKLSRLARGAAEASDEDTVKDLAGYLVLFMVARRRQAAPAPTPVGRPAEPPSAGTRLPPPVVRARPARKLAAPTVWEKPHQCEAPGCTNETAPKKRFCSAACGGRAATPKRKKAAAKPPPPPEKGRAFIKAGGPMLREEIRALGISDTEITKAIADEVLVGEMACGECGALDSNCSCSLEGSKIVYRYTRESVAKLLQARRAAGGAA